MGFNSGFKGLNKLYLVSVISYCDSQSCWKWCLGSFNLSAATTYIHWVFLCCHGI